MICLTRVSCALGASNSFCVVYEDGECEAAKDPSSLRPLTTEETELPRSTLYGRLVYHSSPGSEVDLSAAAVRALGGETHEWHALYMGDHLLPGEARPRSLLVCNRLHPRAPQKQSPPFRRLERGMSQILASSPPHLANDRSRF